jgi:transcriptional regulator with XRE-family HTH domain
MNSQAWTNSLKAALKAQGKTYRDVAEQLNVSQSTVKRWFSSGGISLDQFTQVMVVAGVRLGDLAKLAEAGSEARFHVYTEAQESFLAKHPHTHTFFNLLVRFGTVRAALKKRKIPQSDVAKFLRQLDALGLVEWQKGDRVRFLTSRKLVWRKDGPLRRQFLREAKSEFLDSDFSGRFSTFRFLNIPLTERTAAELMTQMTKFASDANHVSEIEKNVNPDLADFGVLVAVRPWTFSKLSPPTGVAI